MSSQNEIVDSDKLCQWRANGCQDSCDQHVVVKRGYTVVKRDRERARCLLTPHLGLSCPRRSVSRLPSDVFRTQRTPSRAAFPGPAARLGRRRPELVPPPVQPLPPPAPAPPPPPTAAAAAAAANTATTPPGVNAASPVTASPVTASPPSSPRPCRACTDTPAMPPPPPHPTHPHPPAPSPLPSRALSRARTRTRVLCDGLTQPATGDIRGPAHVCDAHMSPVIVSCTHKYTYTHPPTHNYTYIHTYIHTYTHTHTARTRSRVTPAKRLRQPREDKRGTVDSRLRPHPAELEKNSAAAPSPDPRPRRGQGRALPPATRTAGGRSPPPSGRLSQATGPAGWCGWVEGTGRGSGPANERRTRGWSVLERRGTFWMASGGA
jgi:hypothetical protein